MMLLATLLFAGLVVAPVPAADAVPLPDATMQAYLPAMGGWPFCPIRSDTRTLQASCWTIFRLADGTYMAVRPGISYALPDDGHPANAGLRERQCVSGRRVMVEAFYDNWSRTATRADRAYLPLCPAEAYRAAIRAKQLEGAKQADQTRR